MNAVALFFALVLSGNIGCHLEGQDRREVGGAAFTVAQYDCVWDGAEDRILRSFEVWAPHCARYIDQPILIRERRANVSWALNEFGELRSESRALDVQEVYRPQCGGSPG